MHIKVGNYYINPLMITFIETNPNYKSWALAIHFPYNSIEVLGTEKDIFLEKYNKWRSGDFRKFYLDMTR